MGSAVERTKRVRHVSTKTRSAHGVHQSRSVSTPHKARRSLPAKILPELAQTPPLAQVHSLPSLQPPPLNTVTLRILLLRRKILSPTCSDSIQETFGMPFRRIHNILLPL
mmetsp:Transcript_17069/g.35535  ORF Transcript_17069/g.35535 Transcript_17069/m.35535 type:complete len:110 (-) Transcript_17069:390-719(-)